MDAKPTVVGITGTIGSGKSLIGDLLRKRSYKVIDTDEVVHDLFGSDAGLQRAIADRFGREVVTPTGTIDRNKLGDIVFNDAEARRDLEAIVHPAVVQRCDQLVHEHSKDRLVFFLVPLLFEAGLADRYDQIWTVITDDAVLKQRLMQRTGLSSAEVDKRIAAQMPQKEKAARSHKIIDNTGTRDDTERQVADLVKSLL
ncbi:MAG TPA: dephospho-CoA kinase [Candidatus Obscuribacterales bacterium]